MILLFSMKLLLYFLLSFLFMQNTSCSACIDVERTALLTFKSKLKDQRNFLSTWKGHNCCSWMGVTCHNQSGHVVKLNLHNDVFYGAEEPNLSLNGKIDRSLLSLRNLTHLDLSGNLFDETRIPKFIGQFENLVYLNLSSTSFVGKIPAEIGNLKNLRSLDMTNSYLDGPIPSQLGNISTLTFLSLGNPSDLDNVDYFWGKGYSTYEETENIQWISKLNSLQYLDLTTRNLSLSTNWFHMLNQLNNLKVLFLSFCDLRETPASVASLNLSSLTTLVLSYNLFSSPVPNWLENLTSISHLDLSNAGFQGFPNIANLSKLSYLDLSNNHLQGIVSQNIFENLTQLQELDLSNNYMLKLAIDHNWQPKFQLTELALQWCDIGPFFPSWLESQTQIYYMNLQNSSVNDDLPPWFWKPSYIYIDLSYNNLHGKLPRTLQSPNLEILILTSNNLEGPIKSLPNALSILDISNNKFSGTLQWVSNLSQLDMFSVKKNSFNGEIPSSICEMVFAQILDLSNNKLSGIIPNCVLEMKNLEILDISFNNLSGTIPNSTCPNSGLSILILNDNILTGGIPSNLRTYQNLQFLNLGRNKLTGKVPKWIGVSLQNLGYLNLRENNLNGNIPSELALLPKLQLLDIASNDLEGPIPYSFGNFSAMISMPESGYLINWGAGQGPDFKHEMWYTYNITWIVITKGKIIEYSGTLEYMNSIDLSGNNLSGSIPNSIAGLKLLENLNLSRNNLNGKILEIVGNMKSLESLDLSFNKLLGEIPQSISELSFLSYLNLSYNNLSGPIPDGNQLKTLNDFSVYIGNIFLCGSPMNRSCSIAEGKYNTSDNTNNSQALWLYLSIGAGFMAGWWVMLCVLLHKTFSATFFEMVDRLSYKFFKIV